MRIVSVRWLPFCQCAAQSKGAMLTDDDPRRRVATPDIAVVEIAHQAAVQTFNRLPIDIAELIDLRHGSGRARENSENCESPFDGTRICEPRCV